MNKQDQDPMKSQKVLQASMAAAAVIVVAHVSQYIAGQVIGAKMISFFSEINPEEMKGESAFDFMGLLQAIFHLGIALMLPAIGYYGVTKLQKNAVGGFACCSGCCSCCSLLYFVVTVMFLSAMPAFTSEVTTMLDVCDPNAACPMQAPLDIEGKNSKVIDCLAASMWRDEYKRTTDYGTPLTSDQCPQWGFLNCSSSAGQPFAKTVETAETIVRRRLGSHVGAVKDITPKAALQRAARHLSPVQIPLKALAPVLRRLDATGEGDVSPMLQSMDSNAGPGVQDMPEDVQKDCRVNVDLIELWPMGGKFFKEMMPAFTGWMIWGAIVAAASAAAYGWGAFVGSDLFNSWQGA